jgi:Caudovirus prohead serine protease
VKSSIDRNYIRHLTEVQLFEGSPVTFPANTEAQITDVKAHDLIMATLQSIVAEARALTPDYAVTDMLADMRLSVPARSTVLVENKAQQSVRELRALRRARSDDPMPDARNYPIAYLYWAQREAERQAQERKWRDYAPSLSTSALSYPHCVRHMARPTDHRACRMSVQGFVQ